MSKSHFAPQDLKTGELYAGIVLGKDGQPDHHLILLPAKTDRLTWGKATEWAAAAGGELPTRREQSILFGNLKEEFESAWYWSGEQVAADDSYAWLQNFNDGGQGSYRKSLEYRARAVRRLVIE